MSVGRSNNAECQWGFVDGTRDNVAILQHLSKQNAFLNIFWFKFLLKNAFLNDWINRAGGAG